MVFLWFGMTMSNNKYNSLLTAVVVNFFVLLVCILLGEKFYLGIADDYFMARVLEGAYGDSYNVCMTFVNVLYGYALLPLYHLFPKVGWYYIGEIFAVFVSFTTVSYVIIKKMDLQWGSILLLLLIACFARDFYLTVQFTQCAAALGGSGMLFFVYSLERGFTQKKVVWAFALMLWGYCMRSDAFLMGLPIFACILLFYTRKAVACKFRFLICAAIIILGLCGAKYISDVHYSAPDYEKYLDFQPTRVMLGDKINYDKESVYDEIEESGLYGEDYSLLLDWVFYDPYVFGSDSLKQITDKISKYTFPLNWLGLSSRALYRFDCSIVHPCCWAFCLMGIILLALGGTRPFYVCGALIVVLSEMCYLIYLLRLVYRVEIGLWYYATVLAIPLLKGFRPIRCRIFLLVLGSLFVAYTVLFCFTGSFQRSNARGDLLEVPRQEIALTNYKAVFEYMDSMPNNTVFLVPMTTYGAFIHYREPLYYSEPIGSLKRIVPLGFWLPYFPDVENSLREYGIENPMRDVVRGNVVVIGNNEFLLDYLRRHYYKNAEVDTLRNIGGVKFFKYSEGVSDD